MDRTVTEDGGQPGQITEADIDGVEDNRDGQTEGVGEPGATPNPAKDEDDRDNREMDVVQGDETRPGQRRPSRRHDVDSSLQSPTALPQARSTGAPLSWTSEWRRCWE